MATQKIDRNMLNTGIVDNSNATAITIDSSENVGIGTTSPNSLADLHVADTSDARIWLDATSGNTLELYAGSGTSIFNRSNSFLAFGQDNVERMRINTGGNVGIGTTSPIEKLDVSGHQGISVNSNYAHMGSTVSGAMAIFGHNIKSDSANNTIKSANNGYHSSMIKMYYNEGITFHATSGTQSAGAAFYDISGTTNELMRISNAGDLLVGTISTGLNTSSTEAGHNFFEHGYSVHSRSGQTVMSVNRLTNDGNIIDFRKAGSVVGSIGTEGGDMVIGTGDTAVQFADSLDCIRPFTSSGSGNGGRDNAIDLGASGQRFKDIYLSGGVNFSANSNASGMTSELLDDYEEGTFTPTFSNSNSTAVGKYVKIGKQVIVDYHVVSTGGLPSSGGQVQIGNLPFTSANDGFHGAGSLYIGPSNVSSATGGGGTIVPIMEGNATVLRLVNVDTGTLGYTLWGELEVSHNNVVTAIGTFTYTV